MRNENIDIFGGPQHGQITVSKKCRVFESGNNLI